MEKMFKEYVQLEEDLASSFRKFLLYFQSDMDTSYLIQKAQLLKEEIDEELFQFQKSSLSMKKLSIFHDDLQKSVSPKEIDFDFVFSSPPIWNPYVRLFYQIQARWFSKFQLVVQECLLSLSDKEFIYREFLHYRKLHFYFQAISSFDELLYDDVETYYHLLYSFPGLNGSLDTTFSLDEWAQGKNISKEEYLQMEEKEILSMCQILLKQLKPYSIEVLEEIMMDKKFQIYLKMYLMMMKEHKTFWEIVDYFDLILQDSQKKEYMMKFLTSFSEPKEYMRLVKNDKFQYNK